MVVTFHNTYNFVPINMGKYEKITTNPNCIQYNMDINFFNNYRKISLLIE